MGTSRTFTTACWPVLVAILLRRSVPKNGHPLDLFALFGDFQGFLFFPTCYWPLQFLLERGFGRFSWNGKNLMMQWVFDIGQSTRIHEQLPKRSRVGSEKRVICDPNATGLYHSCTSVHPSCLLSSRCFMCNTHNKFDPAQSQFVCISRKFLGSWQQHVLVDLGGLYS